MLACKRKFNPYSHGKFKLWKNSELRIGIEFFLWRKWADNVIVTLDQLIDQDNDFFYLSDLKTNYVLPDPVIWQYLQLMYLTTKYELSATSVQEFSPLLEKT